MSDRAIVKFSTKEPFMTLIKVPFDGIPNKIISDNIGDSKGGALMECVYRCFPLPELVIVCDDSGKIKGLPIVMDSPRGEIAGDILMCQMLRNDDGEYDLYGLDFHQVEFILEWQKRSKRAYVAEDN